MTSHSQYGRIAAVCPTVAQIGHRSGDGRMASCLSVMAPTTSRSRRLYCGHMPYADRIVNAFMEGTIPRAAEALRSGQTSPG